VSRRVDGAIVPPGPRTVNIIIYIIHSPSS
jgi:hypothetical protein